MLPVTLRIGCLLVLLAACSPTLVGQAGNWTAVASTGVTPEQRHESAFVRVGDRFYLLGGRGNRRIQVFDPETNTWSNTNTFLNNIHHFQARAYDGKIYLLGALNDNFPNEDPLTNVVIYDPQADKLSNGPTIPTDRRRGSSGVVLYKDVFYIVSGNRNGHSAYLDDGTTPANVPWVDKYDPRTGKWTVLPDAPHARDHFMAEVIGDRLYVAGGRRSKVGTPAGAWADTEAAVDVFELTTETWLAADSTPADIPTQRAGAATAVLDGKLFVIGGEVEHFPPHDLALPHAEVLDPANGRWQRVADLVLPRHATQAVVHGGRIYLPAGSKTKGGTEIDPKEVFLEAFSQE